MPEVIIRVCGGMVTNVYASDSSIAVTILDVDTDDELRTDEIIRTQKTLQQRIDNGELVPVS